jgi:eukaryotic-like serine/threonine-protein kinase
MSEPGVTIGQHSRAGRKDRNDDSYGVLTPQAPLLTTKGIAMAIADGMSSSEAAKQASETCIKSFLDDYYCTHESWTVKKSAAVVLRAVNAWLYAQGQSQYLSERGMVSTFSGAVLKAGVIHLFHAGDSRISLLRDNTIEPLTRDHRVRVSRERDYLSRAVGIDIDLEVDYRREAVIAGDVLIFTTDGVHDFLETSKIIKIISGAREDLNAAAREITSTAFDNGSPDNLTCQLVRIDQPGQADEHTYLDGLTALPFPPELSSGETFEGLRIITELHASNRSQIYLAVDTSTNQRVVLKTPSVNFEDDPAYIEMFMREEWVGRRLDNANVVRVINTDRPKRFLYYLTEYIEGDTLRLWMQNNPIADLSEVRLLVDQIAAGLRAFHRKDMVHCDIKPENILVDRFGTIKIVDFGSTGVAGLDEIAKPVERPALVGTKAYTAPEYHLGHKPTSRSDLFSLGVIAYEMLTGKLPYGEGFSNARSVSKLDPVPATARAQAIPGWVSAALARATHKNPAMRYETLSEFCADLARPNVKLLPTEFKPLLERNPLAFWKWLALIALLTNLLLVIFLT